MRLAPPCPAATCSEAWDWIGKNLLSNANNNNHRGSIACPTSTADTSTLVRTDRRKKRRPWWVMSALRLHRRCPLSFLSSDRVLSGPLAATPTCRRKYTRTGDRDRTSDSSGPRCGDICEFNKIYIHRERLQTVVEMMATIWTTCTTTCSLFYTIA